MNVIFEAKKQDNKKVPLNNASPGAAKSIYNFNVRDVEGMPTSMEKYRNKVCIIVNIAITNVGFTYHNFTILRDLYKKFSKDGHGSSTKTVNDLGTANQNAVSEHATPSELAQSFKNKMNDISALLGLRILMFPCSQFDDKETKISMKEYIDFINNYRGMNVDLFSRVNVNCDKESPLWKYLKLSVNIGEKRYVKNPYEKFVVNRKGEPTARIGPHASEGELEEAISRCIQQKKML